MPSGPVLRPAPPAVLRALRALEPLFHGPGYRLDRAALARRVAPGFFEIGASGRRYSRAFVLATVAARGAQPGEDRWRTGGFSCLALGPGLYLLAYTLRQGRRVSRRTTLWQRHRGGWRVIFHQGTLVANQESMHGPEPPPAADRDRRRTARRSARTPRRGRR
ncbi:MAG TPA: DUF4440 domain-containing protein [Steroidobacteraceae bacterium]|nr:DUF4440 domain-containing protein [Steroidobacteraceae bacterium]